MDNILLGLIKRWIPLSIWVFCFLSCKNANYPKIWLDLQLSQTTANLVLTVGFTLSTQISTDWAPWLCMIGGKLQVGNSIFHSVQDYKAKHRYKKSALAPKRPILLISVPSNPAMTHFHDWGTDKCFLTNAVYSSKCSCFLNTGQSKCRVFKKQWVFQK